jgi:hypothetical protein
LTSSSTVPLSTTAVISDEALARRAAGYAVSGDTTAAVVVAEFSKSLFGDVLEETVGQLEDRVAAVHRGDLRDAEALLMTQAIGLNSMYTELSVLARINLVKNLDVAERLMRLGLKAQSQSRAALETLAAIKNPPTVFAKQANIAHGPQQVNNSLALARVGESESAPNKVLEAHGERLDGGTADAAIAGDQALATVGTVHRPTDD